MVRSFDVLPAEQTGVDGPGAGSEHGQRSPQGRQDHRKERIARPEEDNPDLDNGEHSACDRCPKASEQKCPCDGGKNLRNG